MRFGADEREPASVPIAAQGRHGALPGEGRANNDDAFGSGHAADWGVEPTFARVNLGRWCASLAPAAAPWPRPAVMESRSCRDARVTSATASSNASWFRFEGAR